MANSECTTNEQASAIPAEPLYKEFSWLSSDTKFDRNARFAASVMAVTHGGYTIANIIRRNSMDGRPPLLGENDLDCLVGLLIYSLETLNEAAEEQIDRLEQAAEKGAKS